MFFEKISFEELRDATSGFSSSNLIGPGNFGDVFKGFLGSDHKLVAVKVLNLLKPGYVDAARRSGKCKRSL